MNNIVPGIRTLVCVILLTIFFIVSFTAPADPGGNFAFYKLNFTVKAPAGRPDLEAEMLIMINSERQKEGLKPLVLDTDLREVARKHSVDMFARGYFSHYTPEKISPFDRMKLSNINYMKAGENLSMAPTLASSHRGLMKSPGHRQNIVKSSFGRVGIGIMDGGRYGLMVTQDFRN